MSYFLSRMSSIFHDFDGRVEKIEHLCAKIGCLPFSLACYFCANKKRNKYDEKDWKIKRMADVAGWLCDGDNFL